MGNDKGYKQRPESYYQPAKLSDRTREGQANGKQFGQEHDFNIKGKSVNTEGSDYHDPGRKTSGLHGNFAEKDASMEYLRARNKEGQEVRHYSANSREARLKTFGGVTAYDSRPVPETYKPATSQGEVPSNAISYKTEEKQRNDTPPMTEDTMSNKQTSPIAKHIKNK